jgi:putative phosphoribosyl transferase
VVVLGLPRGGVPVAAEVARVLGAPLDVVVVRKLGLPQQPELAMGAVGEGGVVVRVDSVVRAGGVPPAVFAGVEQRERAELARRLGDLRSVRPAVPLAGRTAVVVDDGIATGSTARAACAVVRAQGAARVVLAAPVVACDSAGTLAAEVDELTYVLSPREFGAVGRHYADFGQTGDDEVADLLRDQPL